MVQAVVQTTVTGLQGNPVSATVPTANQSLTWSGSAWAPAGPFLLASAGPYLPLAGGSITGALSVGGTLTAGGTVNTGALTANSLNVAGGITGATLHTSGGITSGGGLVVAGTTTVGSEGIIYGTYASNQIAVPWNGGAGVNYIVDGTLLGTLTIVSSDQTLKENIAAITVDCLAVLDQITLNQFDWKPLTIAGAVPRPHATCGFMAQQLQTLIPESVTAPPAGSAFTELTLDQMPILAYCIGAIQQLSARVGALDHQTA